MKFLATAVIILAISIPAFGADVDGKWTGSVPSFDGSNIAVNFTFKADAEKLTGTTTGIDGGEVAIKDGKVDGKTISFTVTFDFGGMPFTIVYKGEVAPEEIKLAADFAGMPFEFVVKKAKPETGTK